MLFIVNPYASEPEYLDPEDAYVEFKRRQYIAALEERQRRVQFERELEREEQRHRLMLASIARQEAERRQREQQHKIQQQRELRRLQQLSAHEQAQRQQQRQQLEPEQRPSREEILSRRRAFQEKEETRSRELHRQILSQIFGVPFDDDTERAESTLAAKESSRTELPDEKVDATAKAAEPSHAPKSVELSQTTEDAPESPTDAYVDAHWSNAPERARALAEIASLGRVFSALKNTFVFPEGRLERLAGTDTPRLAYNPTNTAIHAYEHSLSELLSKLDAIGSHGFKGVREARKQLVNSIEEELSALEQKIAERLASVEAPAAPQEISIPIEDALTHGEEPSKPQDAPTEDVIKDDVALPDETSQDPITQQDVSSSFAKQVLTLEQNPTDSTDAPRDPATQHDISEPRRDEAPRDSVIQDAVPSVVAEQVQDFTTEQKPTNSTAERAGESATKVDAAVEAPEEQPLSDTRPIPNASVPDQNPDLALDRNPVREETVTEHVPPAVPADDAPHDEDSEVEDAVEVMLEPQRTAVPGEEEHEYELV